MGRGIKLRRYDPFEEEFTVNEVKDDRRAAAKVATMRDLETLTRRPGAVSNEIMDYNAEMIDYAPNGGLKVNAANVQKQADALAEQVKATRFYGGEEIARQEAIQAERDGITPRQARGIEQRNHQVKAIAILTAARVGKVSITPHTRGVLNKLAAGQYTEAVFGKADGGTGQRQFERGTYYNQYGFDRKVVKHRDSAARARADEKAETLRSYRQPVRHVA